MRPSEYLKDLLRDAKQFDPRVVAELGRWLDNVNGQTDVLSQTLSSGDAAPLNAPYLVAVATASLLFERVLTVAAPLTATDGGAHGNFEMGITAATTAAAGSMSAADKTKLDGLVAGPSLLPSTLGLVVTRAGDVVVSSGEIVWSS